MIKAVLVDVDDTIFDFNECAKWAIKKCFKKYDFPYPEDMMKTFHQVNDSLWLKIEQGELTIDGLHKIRFNMIFDRMNISLNGVEFENFFVDSLRYSTEEVDGARELLKYLSSKYTVCVVSNAMHKQQAQRINKSGLNAYISDIFTSERIGYPKPSAEFFDGCFALLGGIKPEEAIIIGDSLTADIQGGIGYGIKTCWFNKRQNQPPESFKGDYIVRSLLDIKNII